MWTYGTGGIVNEVSEIEHHHHNVERWVGDGASPTTLTGYTLTSGNNDYGTAVLLLDTGDTPLIAGRTYFDAHRVKLVDVSEDTIYRLRLIFGVSDANTALAADQYTEVTLMFDSANPQQGAGVPFDVRMPHILAGTKVWGQVKNATNLATVEVFLGIHEYDPDYGTLV